MARMARCLVVGRGGGVAEGKGCGPRTSIEAVDVEDEEVVKEKSSFEGRLNV